MPVINLPDQNVVGGAWGAGMYPDWYMAAIQETGMDEIQAANTFREYVSDPANQGTSFGWYWDSFKRGAENFQNQFGAANEPPPGSQPPPAEGETDQDRRRRELADARRRDFQKYNKGQNTSQGQVKNPRPAQTRPHVGGPAVPNTGNTNVPPPNPGGLPPPPPADPYNRVNDTTQQSPYLGGPGGLPPNTDPPTPGKPSPTANGGPLSKPAVTSPPIYPPANSLVGTSSSLATPGPGPSARVPKGNGKPPGGPNTRPLMPTGRVGGPNVRPKRQKPGDNNAGSSGLFGS